jgi:hypothetical protein
MLETVRLDGHGTAPDFCMLSRSLPLGSLEDGDLDLLRGWRLAETAGFLGIEDGIGRDEFPTSVTCVIQNILIRLSGPFGSHVLVAANLKG